MTGEVWRISGTVFYFSMLRERTTVDLFRASVRERHIVIKYREDNRHNELKFTNIEVSKPNSAL